MEANRVQPGRHWKLRIENAARDVELLQVQFHLVAPIAIAISDQITTYKLNKTCQLN